MEDAPKPDEQPWIPKPIPTREILRDACVGLLPMLPAGAIVVAAGIIARRFVPWSFGMLVALGTMILVGWALTPPVRRMWKKAVVPRLSTAPPVHGAIFALSLAVALLLVAFVGALFGVGSVDFTFAIVGPIGFVLLGTGLTLRSGDSRHCPKCDFETPPQEAPLPEKCPECGLEWTDVLIKGRRIRTPLLIRTGATLIGLWVVLTIFAISGLGPIVYRATPTPMLLALIRVTNPHGLSMHQRMTEIQTNRTLTLSQRDGLARHVLLRAQRDSSVASSAAPWLDANVTAPGGFSEEVRQLYFEQLLKPRLSAPARATVGEAVPITVLGRWGGTFLTIWPWMRIERIDINGETMLDQPGEWVFGLYVTPSHRRTAPPSETAGADHLWTPQSPGPHEITVTIRLAAAPQPLQPPTHPISPLDPPVLWSQTMTLRGIIDVRP